MNKINNRLPSSFKDPSGFVFKLNNTIYRQVNKSYCENYNILINNGLYEYLANDGYLISHEETHDVDFQTIEGYKIIKPKQISFISYPYEWCFDQLKDAALATLRIQQKALDFGMVLKDATPYNIQFLKGKPVFIDTLSFEKYITNHPWVAYKQFCEHFLAPLCLMHYTDIRLFQLLKTYIDGVPLDLTSRLLPAKSKLSFSILSHIHLHAYSQKYYANKTVKSEGKLSLKGLQILVQNLINVTNSLTIKKQKTEWGFYYNNINYIAESELHKKTIVSSLLEKASPKTVWDFGSNTGLYSRIASEKGIETISFDIDEIAVNTNYKLVKEKKESNILPLILDLTNPSANIGWANNEKDNLERRGPANLIMALALIHHLAISNNVPLLQIASYFHRLGKWLIIEFIPKSDSQFQRLLLSKKDIYLDYSCEQFESDFQCYFSIIERIPILGSERILYLMQAK